MLDASSITVVLWLEILLASFEQKEKNFYVLDDTSYIFS